MQPLKFAVDPAGHQRGLDSGAWKSWPTWQTLWVNCYFESMFSKFSGLALPSLPINTHAYLTISGRENVQVWTVWCLSEMVQDLPIFAHIFPLCQMFLIVIHLDKNVGVYWVISPFKKNQFCSKIVPKYIKMYRTSCFHKKLLCMWNIQIIGH